METPEKIFTRRRRLIINRNICFTVAVLFAFNAWSLIKDGGAPVSFIVLTAALIIGFIVIGTIGHINVKKLDVQLEEARQAAEAENAEPVSDELPDETKEEDTQPPEKHP